MVSIDLMNAQQKRSRSKDKTRSPPSEDNPFLVKEKPPSDETEEERIRRVQIAQDAQKRSQRIDESLCEARKQLEKRKRAVKILLLGQSESGKSSVLRNFQFTFTPSHINKERDPWRKVVQLNLVGNVKVMLNAMQRYWDEEPTPSLLTKTHKRYHLSLSPLVSIHTNLTGRECSEHFDARASGGEGKGKQPSQASFPGIRYRELFDPASLLEASKEDILALWLDDDVRRVLAKQNIRLQETPGFFLDDIERISRHDFIPQDRDIVRARIRTLDVEEHHFITETGDAKNSEFFITDIAGHRSSRNAWIPYFDDAQTILFLAPLLFNQMLDEDPTVNRLEDTLGYWKEICKSELLAKSNLIVFFNKMDLLKAILDSGIQLKKFVPSYGDQPNDLPNVTKYFKDRFRSYHKKLSPKPRPFVAYDTSAIDVKAMSALLAAVQDGIFRDYLKDSSIL